LLPVVFDRSGVLQETRRDEIRDEIHEALGIEISKDDDEEDEEEDKGAAPTHYLFQHWGAKMKNQLLANFSHACKFRSNGGLGSAQGGHLRSVASELRDSHYE
jgi:hypothetical protein